MSGPFSILDLIILAGGVYLLWAAFGMKTKNKIPGMLVSKGTDLSKAKDIPGFTKVMFMPTLIMGAVASASGILGIVDQGLGLATVQFVLSVVSFVLLVGYGYLTVRFQKKYL